MKNSSVPQTKFAAKFVTFKDKGIGPRLANQNGEFNRNILTPEIESDMQEVVQLVLQKSSDDINTKIKLTFLLVAKSFYYAAYCDSKTINFHIGKVIFETVD
ncbi:hypothetical protein CsatA_027899 [Cannabis sativa]